MYGVAEALVVGPHGIVRHKRIGPVDHAALYSEIAEMVRELDRDEG